MRGLWIEELVASHSIKYRGALYKILSFFERKTLKSASKIITLTYKSKEYISETYGIDKSKVVVIPTCVDLVTFLPSIKPLRKERIRFVVLGTVLSGWFRFDMLLDFMMIISKNFQEAQFSIFTADSKKDIKQKIAESNYYFHNLDINICYKKRKELALELNHFDFGVMFYNSTNLCEIARSPTKIGELLASGVPIIINQGIGDIDALLSCNEVGLCINEEHFQLQGQIQNKITNLINNSSIRKTCREVALKTYSVREGSEKYSNCYQSLSYSK
jgi:glycosyltransferase involved in cell wall biosynthesis